MIYNEYNYGYKQTGDCPRSLILSVFLQGAAGFESPAAHGEIGHFK